MNATDDEDYMRWWNSHGDMAEPEIEYRAWKAGRAFEKSRPTQLAPDAKPAGAFLGDGYSGFARVKQTIRRLRGEHERN